MRILIASLLFVLGAGCAFAQDVGSGANEVSGNVALTTDYRFRGISQTNTDPAIQGGLDFSMEPGIYIGAWGSNVAFGSSVEMDFYVGFASDISEDISYDVGVLYYSYPGDSGMPTLDYTEIYGSLGFYGATVALNYSPDYFAGTDSFWYVAGDYSFPLGDNFSIDAHLGLNMFDSSADFTEFLAISPFNEAGDDYLDYSLGISTSAAGVDFALQYVGTDISSGNCVDICDDEFVFTISKSM